MKDRQFRDDKTMCCAKDGGTAMQQRIKESKLPDEKAIQDRFINYAAMEFIRSQRINLWWNSTARNEKFSEAFNSALIAILDGNYAGAKRLRRKAEFGFIKWPVSCFAWLLYAEAEFFCKVLGRKMPLPNDKNWPFSFFPIDPNGGRYRRFIKCVQRRLPKSRILAKTYAAFATFRDSETEYARLPVKNCIVCATMSAGKSTFINALLGKDVLPARNSATTAKVTSVYDKDGADGIIGFTQKTSGEFTDVRDGVDAKTIDGWNNDAEVSRIFLQGDFDGIPNKGFKITVHDTPGTNNSGDSKHLQITKEFLCEAPADAIVYVVNTEHRCMTDEGAYLKELLKTVIQREMPVLFLMNKADCIDTEKECLALEDYKSYLAGIGFSNPKVHPVSSKDARLVKMALTGRSKYFSEMELDEFPSIVRRFTKRLVFDNRPIPQDLRKDAERITIGGEEYDPSILQTALIHTGIQLIETELEKLLTTRNPQTGEYE